MGLHIHSLENIPETANRDYFIYLLDYGWDEPISNALKSNFEKMAQKAASNRAVIIRGTEIGHFENEVFSWHRVNGLDATDILPALLITNKHPRWFQKNDREWNRGLYREDRDSGVKLIIIPFKKFCKTTTEVVTTIEKLFDDIINKKDIRDFKICATLNRGRGKAIFDALLLEPNISGIGIDLKKIFKSD